MALTWLYVFAEAISDGGAVPRGLLLWFAVSTGWFLMGGVAGLVIREIFAMALSRDGETEAFYRMKDTWTLWDRFRYRVFCVSRLANRYFAVLVGVDQHGNKIV